MLRQLSTGLLEFSVMKQSPVWVSFLLARHPGIDPPPLIVGLQLRTATAESVVFWGSLCVRVA
jgi:hypothetical protein